MVNVFLDAYTLTDTTVRKSFERLLQTWKNGMPGGLPVFPRHVIEPIERSIIYIREKTPTSRYPPHNNNITTTTTNASRFNKPPVNNTGIHVNPNFIQKVSRHTNLWKRAVLMNQSRTEQEIHETELLKNLHHLLMCYYLSYSPCFLTKLLQVPIMTLLLKSLVR
jgi:pre-mRNA cleavage complex 2 protein Pcf11